MLKGNELAGDSSQVTAGTMKEPTGTGVGLFNDAI